MTRVRTLCTAFALSLALLFATQALAEPTAWDQSQVSAIGKDLAAAGEGWEQAVRRQPGLTVGSGESEDVFDMLEESRMLNEQTAALSAELTAGKGHDKTYDMYRTLKEMVDDTQVQVERADLIAPTKEAWAKLTDAMGRLAPYYKK